MWLKAVVTRSGIWTLTKLDSEDISDLGYQLLLANRLMPLEIKGHHIISNLGLKRRPKFGV